MEEPPPVASPGWYDGPEGRRFWDGNQWLVPATSQAAGLSASPSPPQPLLPPAPTPVAPPTARRKWPWVVVSAAIAAVAIVAIVLVVDANAGLAAREQAEAGQAELEADRERNRNERAEAKAKADRQAAAAIAQAQEDAAAAELAHVKEMVEYGWNYFAPGLYYNFVPPNSYTCGYNPCAYVIFLTEAGCPSGLYAETSILSGELSVGYSNGITAALPPGGQAQLRFDNFQGDELMYEVTDVHCMG